MATNLELKVRCTTEEMQCVRESATAAGLAPFIAMTHRDTYFHAQQGRLKLREIHHQDGTQLAELLAYTRPDQAEARWSNYTRVEIPIAVADTLRALGSTLGVKRVVEKTREVGIWRRTRIHLDDVQDLGLFVELETVSDSQSDPSASQELTEAARMLGLDKLEVVAGSYGEMDGPPS
jgi:predicted adenylyl cyclase CyaB